MAAMDETRTAPDPQEAERLEAGRLLFAHPWSFVMGVAKPEQLPPVGGIEVAFAGRSNVGKSSLINALTGQGGLARTSNTPGRTRELNLFAASPELTLVDMPGYGYAAAGKALAEAWTKLVFAYLRGRPNLRRAYVLVDSRHGLKPNDLDVMKLLDRAAVSYQVVLTKADKPKAAELATVMRTVAAALKLRAAAHPEVILTSSETGLGIPLLRAEIAALRPGGD
ncbi:MAG: YihA family ribosome biogenesis GTP-binding protein [Bauldia sp.]|nr:YihA family ribosome biogenesis GTP-binding protein [Bauldia sp.]